MSGLFFHPLQIKFEPQHLFLKANVHLRNRPIGLAVGVFIMFETRDGLFLCVHRQRLIPAKGHALPTQGGAARAKFLPLYVHSQHLFLELGKIAIRTRPSHVAQPDVVLP